MLLIVITWNRVANRNSSDDEHISITPLPGFVIKTRRNPEQTVKVFINILTSENVSETSSFTSKSSADKSGKESIAYDVVVPAAKYKEINIDEEKKNQVLGKANIAYSTNPFMPFVPMSM